MQARDEDSDRLLDTGAESDALSGLEDNDDKNTKGAGWYKHAYTVCLYHNFLIR